MAVYPYIKKGDKTDHYNYYVFPFSHYKIQPNILLARLTPSAYEIKADY